MPNPTGVGFFGKLPSTGDFVQRRLPSSFVDVWDQHFERAVDASRRALGAGWQQAYFNSPVWRFVLGSGVCTASAWIGVMGPASDRVGRCFPMVIAMPLDDPSSAAQVLRHGETWFDAVERVHVAAQSNPSTGVEAFDTQVIALADMPVASASSHPFDAWHAIEWHTANQWRLPLPRVSTAGTFLADLWARVTATDSNWGLWWSGGGGQVPASALVTRGLPQASAYAGFLDAAHADATWQSLGVFDDVTPPTHAAHRHAAHVSVASHVTMTETTQVPAPTPRAVLPDDLSELFADLAPPVSKTIASDSVGESTSIAGMGSDTVVSRSDIALVLVAADEGVHDPRRQAAATAGKAVNDLTAQDLATGMQALRERLLTLHPRLHQSSEDLINPIPEDGSVIAVRITGPWADLLRIGTAAAWHWRNGQLQSLFATGTTSPTSDGSALTGDFDDLLFTRAAPVASGLGGPTQPLCDEIVCAVEAGDRLLLVATQNLVQLSPDVYARALAMPNCDDARARIATAASLGADPAHWPLAVIEVRS